MSSSLIRPSSRTLAPTPPDQPAKASLVAARTGDHHDEVRMAGLQTGCRSDEDVHPLARHEPANARHHHRVLGKLETSARRSPVARGVGESADVDARRDLDNRVKSPAHEPLGLRPRVATRRDDDRRLLQDRPQPAADERQPSRDGQLGSVEHDPVGHAEARPQEAERPRRIEEHDAWLLGPTALTDSVQRERGAGNRGSGTRRAGCGARGCAAQRRSGRARDATGP